MHRAHVGRGHIVVVNLGSRRVRKMGKILDKVITRLEGVGDTQGEIEEALMTADNTKKALGNLVELLVGNGVIHEHEVECVLEGIY